VTTEHDSVITQEGRAIEGQITGRLKTEELPLGLLVKKSQAGD
jgi:hypothetical protein